MIRSKDLFVDPPIQFRPVPLWFWNSMMDKAEIERQIRMMDEAGLGGFFMQARFGLETEYMSEEWLDCVRYAIMVAKRLRLKASLYDEYEAVIILPVSSVSSEMAEALGRFYPEGGGCSQAR